MIYKRIPTHLALAAFPSESAADSAAKELHATLKKTESRSGDSTCNNFAVISKSIDCKVKVTEHGQNGPLHGLVEGGVAGTFYGAFVGGLALSLLGDIGATVGEAAGGIVGAAVGGVGGSLSGTLKGLTIDSMDQKQLAALAECLEPGSSMLITCFEEVVVKKSDLLSKYSKIQDEADSLLATTAININESIRENKIFGVTILVGEEGVSATKWQTRLSKEAIGVAAVLVTPQGGMLAETALNVNGKGSVVGLAYEDSMSEEGDRDGLPVESDLLVEKDVLVCDFTAGQKSKTSKREEREEAAERAHFVTAEPATE